MVLKTKLLDSILAEERAVFSISLWSGLLLVDGIVWSRRLSGAMTVPLAFPLVWGSSLIITAVAIGALICWRETLAAASRRPQRWPELLTLLLPLAWGVGVGMQTSPLTWGGLAALWGNLIVAVGLVHRWFPPAEAARTAGEPASEVAGVSETASIDEGRRTADNVSPTHFQRRSVVDGVEVIEGEAAVEFLPGQKEATLHLSFCPPFSVVPEVHAEDALGGDLEIRAEAVHPFGARLSIRRASGVEAAESRQISYSAGPSAAVDAAA